ncbi:MAG: hypothetical protein AABO41_06720 [Acidobacteriota bacterium]
MSELQEEEMKRKDWLHTETDDACAVCGIRGTHVLTVHHIDGDHSNNVYDNTIILCHNCHTQHNQKKGLTREQIENRKRHLIQKTLTQYGLNALKIADRNQFGVVAMPFPALSHGSTGLYDKRGETDGVR